MNRSAIPSSGLLDRIVAAKHAEVAGLSGRRADLRTRARSAAAGHGPGATSHGGPAAFETALRAGSFLALIAEVKRRSPSAGLIDALADPPQVARAYENAGARAISVLTDAEFFGGSLADLEAVYATVSVPVLRKDFTIDEVQIHEARVAGAAAVLLIARLLDDAELRGFREEAEGLGMSALVEVHGEAELARAVGSGARIIGINSRDLDTLHIDLAGTAALLPSVPRACVAVAESGIRTVADAALMAECGADAVLVGEALMKQGIDGAGASAMAMIPRTARAR